VTGVESCDIDPGGAGTAAGGVVSLQVQRLVAWSDGR
jgi:hypothetical protein